MLAWRPRRNLVDDLVEDHHVLHVHRAHLLLATVVERTRLLVHLVLVGDRRDQVAVLLAAGIPDVGVGRQLGPVLSVDRVFSSEFTSDWIVYDDPSVPF